MELCLAITLPMVVHSSFATGPIHRSARGVLIPNLSPLITLGKLIKPLFRTMVLFLNSISTAFYKVPRLEVVPAQPLQIFCSARSGIKVRLLETIGLVAFIQHKVILAR